MVKIKTTRAFTMFGAGELGTVKTEVKPGEILDVDEMQANILFARGEAVEHGSAKPAKNKAEAASEPELEADADTSGGADEQADEVAGSAKSARKAK